MIEIITCRLSQTGIWRYEFCAEGKPAGSVVSRVSRSEPARIEGFGVSWYSSFDMDLDLVPGLSRKVKDSRTGDEIYRIIWWRTNLYEVRAKAQSVQVEIRNGCYLFGIPGMPVTAMTEHMNGVSGRINGLEAEACMRTKFFEPVNGAYQMMALSFPALRFC